MSEQLLEPDGWIRRQDAADLDAKAAAKEARRRQTSELSRLTKFIKKGGELLADELPGVGLLWRSRARTASPFSAEIVLLWREKEEIARARAERRAAAHPEDAET